MNTLKKSTLTVLKIMSQKKVLILGSGGQIGAYLTEYLRKKDYDVREFDVGYLSKINAESVPFEVLLDRSDIVTVHVPLNSMTKGLFDSEVFKAMKSNAVFINTCRGPVHDERALIRALDQKEIAAAGLDVFEEEPLPRSSALWKLHNVLIQPHLSAASPQYLELFVEELAARILGQPNENI